jgi:hypothetical protein
MALPDIKFLIQFSEHNAYCCVGVGEKIKHKEGLTEGCELLYKE